jgi:uncharacterized membrane protein YecN with MAPEG domain
MLAYRLSALTTLAILATYIWTALLVSQARVAHGVEAPRTTGPDAFERVYRVHVNTLEQMAIMLPALWIAAGTVADWYGAVCGLIWIAGRVWFARGYTAAAQRRGPGFALTMAGFGLAFVGGAVALLASVMR